MQTTNLPRPEPVEGRTTDMQRAYFTRSTLLPA
jgi:hypothetical protein